VFLHCAYLPPSTVVRDLPPEIDPPHISVPIGTRDFGLNRPLTRFDAVFVRPSDVLAFALLNLCNSANAAGVLGTRENLCSRTSNRLLTHFTPILAFGTLSAALESTWVTSFKVGCWWIDPGHDRSPPTSVDDGLPL
jgi:hypothetical protein